MPNDWKITNFLLITTTIALAVLIMVSTNFVVPGLRQVVGFLFLAFVPGFIILRILKIHNISMTEALLYSVGLSIAFSLFVGLFMHLVLPIIGVSRPFTPLPVASTLTLFTVILIAIAYIRDRKPSIQICVEPRRIFTPSNLLLILVFLLNISGALIIYAYGNNVILMMSTIIITILVSLAVFCKFLKQRDYPLAITVIAISILYQVTLVSPNLIGIDIHGEYYFQRLVVDNGYWDATITHLYNSALSVVILAPIYSIILHTDTSWIFKVIYPLFFALVPLALYRFYQHQIGANKAFLAAFFFVIVPVFSLEIIAITRQQIAELFFALFLLLIIDNKLSQGQKFTLAAIFILSITLSHYSTAAVFFVYVALGWLLLILTNNLWFKKLWRKINRKERQLPETQPSPQAFPFKLFSVLLVLFIVCTFFYYGWAASGRPLEKIIQIASGQIETITTETLLLIPVQPKTSIEPAAEPTSPTEPGDGAPAGPEEPVKPSRPSRLFDLTRREGLVKAAVGLDFGSVSTQGKVFRIFQYITQIFIIVGFIMLLFKRRRLGFSREHIVFSLVSVLILAACIFSPGFSSTMNATRIYHLTLFILAPVFILGGESIWMGIRSLFRKVKLNTNYIDEQTSFNIFILAVLIPYFLFTSGFIFEITKQKVIDSLDTPFSYALSSYRVDIGGVANSKDLICTDWLAMHLVNEHYLYADLHGSLLIEDYPLLAHKRRPLPSNIEELSNDNYVFLRTWNIESQSITKWAGIGLRRQISLEESGLIPYLMSRNKIYDNGGSQVLAPVQ